ncbi:MAG: hypothetical protein NVSMB57_04630 [Actinomycetota bacterium]
MRKLADGSIQNVPVSKGHAVFEPRDGRFERLALRIGGRHPLLGIAAAALISYVAITGILIAAGMLMTHVLAHGGIGHWDDQVGLWFVRQRTRLMNGISGDFTWIADTLGIVVVAAAITALLLFRRWRWVAALLPVGLVFELTSFLTSNYLVARARPAVKHLGSTPSTFSWPSGHSAASVVLYGGIALLVMAATRHLLPIVLAWTGTFIVDVGVGLSRVYRGEHHITDVAAGYLLGLGALATAVYVVRAWRAAALPTGESSSYTATNKKSTAVA